MTAPAAAAPGLAPAPPPRREIPRQDDDYTAAAARRRLAFLTETTGAAPEHLGRYSFDPAVLDGNIENFIGVAQVPVGIAGPLLAAGDLRDAVTRPLRQLAEVPGLFRLARRDDVLNYSRGLGRDARDLAEPSAISLNGPIGPRRRWTWTTASLADLKQIRAAHGGTINDVVLAAVTGAFRDLLEQRGELADGLVLRSLVPVSVRGPGEDGAITNRVSAVLANLPVDEADPLRRLDLIRQEMDQLKHTHQAVSAEVFTEMLGLVLGSAPMWLALGTQVAFRIRQPLVQTVTTNVPGPRSPLYVLGRPMTALYPYVPIGNAVRPSVAILSYVDTVSFGVTADYDAAPDLDTFTEGIRRSLAELGGRGAREGAGS